MSFEQEPTDGETQDLQLGELLESLKLQMEQLPENIQKDVQTLLKTYEHIDAADIEWITANLDQIEGSVYGASVYSELMRATNFECKEQIDNIFDVQKASHSKLGGLGIKPIYPGPASKFDQTRHDFSDNDIVWINKDPEKDNLIHSVRSLGFIKDDGTVLKKARVRRYHYLK